MLVHLGVPGCRNHVDEGLRGWVLDDENRIPPRAFAITDDHRRRAPRIAEGGADALQVRNDLLSVLQVALQAALGLELQQVDHHHRRVCRSRGQGRELLGCRLQAAHVNLLALVSF